MTHIGTISDFENKYNEITLQTDEVLRFISRNPGKWGDNIEIAIANPEDFGQDKQAFPGIDLDSFFEYFPDAADSEVGIIVKEGKSIREIHLVSLEKGAKDTNGKSKYIENVINRTSSFIYCKYIGDYEDGIQTCLNTSALKLANGTDEEVTPGDIANAYDVWSNKEEVDIDIIIGNEIDNANAAFNLAEARKDCIAFFGTDYSVVGLKAALASKYVVTHRSDRNSMFSCYAGNYKYQYDRYNDKNRWINISGDVAGLRAGTSNNRASWWASAGLERGQIKNCIKLAFNPSQQQRDYNIGLAA